MRYYVCIYSTMYRLMPWYNITHCGYIAESVQHMHFMHYEYKNWILHISSNSVKVNWISYYKIHTDCSRLLPATLSLKAEIAYNIEQLHFAHKMHKMHMLDRLCNISTMCNIILWYQSIHSAVYAHIISHSYMFSFAHYIPFTFSAIFLHISVYRMANAHI